MSKTIQTRLGLFITEENKDGYYHVRAHVVTLGTNAWERRMIDQGMENLGSAITHDTIRNMGDETERGLYLNNFRITSQGNDADTDRRLYGFECRYQDVYAVDLATAEKMARTLKTIAARMAKSEALYGHPSTFGAYVARVAAAIGAECLVRTAGPSRGWSYRENSHTIRSIRDGAFEIDHHVRRWASRAAEAVSA